MTMGCSLKPLIPASRIRRTSAGLSSRSGCIAPKGTSISSCMLMSQSLAPGRCSRRSTTPSTTDLSTPDSLMCSLMPSTVLMPTAG